MRAAEVNSFFHQTPEKQRLRFPAQSAIMRTSEERKGANHA